MVMFGQYTHPWAVAGPHGQLASTQLQSKLVMLSSLISFMISITTWLHCKILKHMKNTPNVCVECTTCASNLSHVFEKMPLKFLKDGLATELLRETC